MNPTTLAHSAPRALNDNSQTAQPPASAAASQTLTTNIVSNIPVHAPSHPLAPRPASEDDELDKIMQDVGQQLRQAERHTPKKRLFHIGHKAKPIAPTHPITSLAAVTEIVTDPPVAHAAPTVNLRPDNVVKISSPAASKRTGSLVLLVLLTVAVTAVLMAAAIYAYRQN